MKPSGIGGQALIEGIMMRHKDEYSCAVRKPDQEIALKKEKFKSVVPSPVVKKIPLVRGVISFIDSLVIGLSTLMYSASFFEEEEPSEKEKEKLEKMTAEEKEKKEKSDEKKENALMYAVFFASMAIAVVIFMLLPYYLSELLGKVITAKWLLALMEAVTRVLIFVIYLLLISRMEDIQRTFMYHGAEHKCINCIEHGMDLNVENVMKSSRFHKRCGTSFLVLVVIISAVLLMFIRTDSRILRVVYRLVLIPVIAGISFEILQWAGRSDGLLVNILSKPGLAMQKLTTKEPDESMVEVAIVAVEAVFDWKTYLQENFDRPLEAEKTE